MLHGWNIYQHLPHKWPSFVGKYTIHGSYGNRNIAGGANINGSVCWGQAQIRCCRGTAAWGHLWYWCRSAHVQTPTAVDTAIGISKLRRRFKHQMMSIINQQMHQKLHIYIYIHIYIWYIYIYTTCIKMNYIPRTSWDEVVLAGRAEDNGPMCTPKPNGESCVSDTPKWRSGSAAPDDESGPK